MWTPETRSGVFPWSLAIAARESVRAGNEHRPSGVTVRDLVEISSKYHNLYDPLYDDNDAFAYLVRTAYEQFPFQEPLFFGLSRSRLLFQKPSPEALARTRVVDAPFWETTLGADLETLFTAGFVFGVGALHNGGRFDLSWYSQTNFGPVSVLLSEDDATNAMTNLFAATQEELRAMCPTTFVRGYERVAFNPLRARPFLKLSDSAFLAPVPQFAFWRASAPSLYYMALERLADDERGAFTEDVGTLFEDYVLRQANQLPIEAVYGAIEYRPGSHTTDVTLVWPEFIVLVEAKASRLREESRMGGESLRDDFERTVGRALKQIEHTAELIQRRHPGLAHIPGDRPIFGLVATLEPYYVAGFGRDANPSYATKFPVAVVSIRELEQLVADFIGDPPTLAELEKCLSPNRMGWTPSDLHAPRADKLFRNPMLDREYRELTDYPGIAELEAEQ